MAYNVSKNQINLYPMAKYKDIVIKEIINNSDCVDAILGENNEDLAKGYDACDILLGNALLGLNGQIKQQLAMLKVQVTAKTYILIDSLINDAESTRVKSINLTIQAFTHLSSIELSSTEKSKFYSKGYAGDRVDVILDIITRMFNSGNLTTEEGKLRLGIGTTVIYPRNPMKILIPIEDYYGRSIVLNSVDF